MLKKGMITKMSEKEKAELSEKELLEQILEENRKRTFYARISMFVSMAVLGMLVLCLVIELPKINVLITKAETTLEDVQTTLDSAQSALTQVETSAKELEGMIDSIDYEGLNEAIGDLQDAVEPFANLVNRFK